MKTNKLIQLAIAGLLATGFTQSAQANVLASAILDISNIKFTNNATSAALNNLSDFTIVTGNNTGSLSVGVADLGPNVSTSQSVTVASGGAIPPTSPVSVGTQPGYTNTDFTSLITPPSASYSYANNSLTGALINVYVPTPGGPVLVAAAGANSSTRADSGLTTNTTGSASSLTGTTTSVQFISNANESVTVSFDYLAKLYAYVSPDSKTTSSALSRVSWSFTLTDLTHPDNTHNVKVAGEPGLLDINNSISNSDYTTHLLAPSANNAITSNTSGSISQSFALFAGDNYQLSISQEVDVTTVNTVPEPATLSILGLGFFNNGLYIYSSPQS